MKPLRTHQEHAMLMLKRSVASGNRRPLVQAPTGFGKTILAAHIVKGAIDKGNRVIFVVPAIDLVDQTVESFMEQGIRAVGVLQGNHPLTDPTKPVQVASIQTLARRKIPPASLVIIDEAHRMHKFLPKWIEQWSAVPFIGLSATPWTRGLGKIYDDLIIASTTPELIRAGYLSNFRVFAPDKPDLSKVRTTEGDYNEKDLGEVMDDSILTANIVDNWIKNGEGRPTLVFAVNRAHAKALQVRFQDRGIETEYIDAFTDRPERRRIAGRFGGEVKVVVNVGCLTTGVDWDVRCIVLARPTKSEMLFTQIIGRGLRTAEGKDHCLIFDHSDTHQRLGFVTDIHHETLCDGKQKQLQKKKQQALPKECPSCTYLKPPKVHKCPACGFKPEASGDIDEGAGELKEMTKERRNRITSAADKRRFFGELKSIGYSRGYSSGWASNQYRNRFGVWPNAHKGAPTCEPSKETYDWVTSQMIRYAKRNAG